MSYICGRVAAQFMWTRLREPNRTGICIRFQIVYLWSRPAAGNGIIKLYAGSQSPPQRARAVLLKNNRPSSSTLSRRRCGSIATSQTVFVISLRRLRMLRRAAPTQRGRHAGSVRRACACVRVPPVYRTQTSFFAVHYRAECFSLAPNPHCTKIAHTSDAREHAFVL